MIKKVLIWFGDFKIHLLIWSLYMTYEALWLGIAFNDFRSPIIYISHYFIVFLLFYFHADFTLPSSKKVNGILLLPIVITELIVYVFLQYLVTIILASIDLTVRTGKEFDLSFVLRNTYRCILFMGFSTGYYYLKTYLKERKKTEDLEKERLEKIIQQQKMEQELVVAQNAYLKAQINPHFLFNTLDFIYHKVNKHSELAGEAVIKLAQMMRFAIDSDQMEQTIFLADEIEQVENLLYLYQIRKNTELNLHFAYTNEVKNLRLIPLVVLTLVENIFKHGDLSNPDEIAFVNLAIKHDALVIQTVNLISMNRIANSHHSGLNNIHKRLNFAYGDEIVFTHQVTNHHFKVEINIPISLLK